MDGDGHATRFAFVRNGGSEAVSAVGLALRRCGVNESTSVTVLTDGDAGLRAIHQQVAPQADHILDWFHIAMRFTNLQQLAKGIDSAADGGKRSHALAEIDRAKWRLWNGLAERGIIGLVHLEQWAQAKCFDDIPSLSKLARMLSDMIRYLELNADSMAATISSNCWLVATKLNCDSDAIAPSSLLCTDQHVLLCSPGRPQ